MENLVDLERNEIVVGKPLPFAIYDVERKVLLAAKGQIVSETMRERCRGTHIKAIVDGDYRVVDRDSTTVVQGPSPLFLLRQQMMRSVHSSKIGFKMSRDERSEATTSWVIGARERRSLMLSVPSKGDKEYINVSEGQTWLFRTFHSTAAIRFSARIEKVAFEPFPYFHIEIPANIEMRTVRNMPRAPACIPATLDLETPTEALVVDLCAEGLRLALRKDAAVAQGGRYPIRFRIPLLGEVHDIHLIGTVARAAEIADSVIPDIVYYGVSIETRNATDRTILHAFAQEQLAQELDVFSRLIAE